MGFESLAQVKTWCPFKCWSCYLRGRRKRFQGGNAHGQKSFQSFTSDFIIVRGAVVDEPAVPLTAEEVAVDANVKERNDMVSMVLC